MKIVYVLVDEKLKAGLKISQSCHSVAELVNFHDGIEVWVELWKTIVILETSITSMHRLRLEAGSLGVKSYPFVDKDLGPDITSIAFSPISKSMGNNLFSSCSLALSK